MENNIEKLIEQQEEDLPKKIVDLVWSITDGGCKLRENQLLSYQEEPVREYEYILAWHKSSIKQILEVLVVREESKRVSGRDTTVEDEAWNRGKFDTISYLKQQIKLLE